MKVFVAGATGILGRRAVRSLVLAGHDVSGVARSEDKRLLIEKLGATGVGADIFDAAAVEAAVAGHDAVINLATHIPTPMRIAMLRAWRENDRIRSHASRNLVDAAIAAGARRYVQESIGFFYEDRGDAWVDESTPVDLPQHARSSADAEAEAERFTGAGVVLRFGMFYAPDSAQSRLQIRLARMGMSPYFGSEDEHQSIVHVDDAASSVLAALEAPAGTYNVVDDEPLTKGESSSILAEALGKRRLVRVPRPLLAAGGTVIRALMRSQRVANERFRKATGWSPRYSSAREGISALVEETG